MINLLALGLLISTLAASTLWQTPPPPAAKPHHPVHRLIIVEYVHPLPTDHNHLIQEAEDKLQEADDKLQESTSLVPATPPPNNDGKENLSTFVSHATSKVDDGVKDLHNMSMDMAEQVVDAFKNNFTDIVQRAREVLYDVAALIKAPETVRTAAAAAHLVAVAATYGICVWVTFVSSYMLGRGLPRQQFGVVQSRMYPVYFRAVGYGVGVALAGFWYSGGAEEEEGRVQGYNLAAVLGAVVMNMMCFEPKAAKVMFELMKMEKEGVEVAADEGEEGEEEAVRRRVVKLSGRLRRLNWCSSFLNVVALMGLTWHLVDLAQGLEVSC